MAFLLGSGGGNEYSATWKDMQSEIDTLVDQVDFLTAVIRSNPEMNRCYEKLMLAEKMTGKNMGSNSGR